MRSLLQLSVGLIVLATAVAAIGCSNSYGGRKEITGMVKLVGEPIQDGTINFKPLDKNIDTQQGAQIKNGEYKIPGKQGLKPGKYNVSISAGDDKTSIAAPLEEGAGPGPSRNFMAVDRVPPEWNIQSTKEVEVKADGKNELNFDIPNYNPQYLKLKKK
jgi:hypothetical protein